jgi:hypothetical protein
MATKVKLSPEAETDLDEAYGWYEERQSGLGEEFGGCGCLH